MARGRGVVIKIDSVMGVGEKLDQEPKGHERFFYSSQYHPSWSSSSHPTNPKLFFVS